MKIRSIDAIPLNARLAAPFKFGHVVRTRSANVLVRVTTEDGLVGWGEACPVPQLTAETQSSICAAIADRVAPAVVGEDAFLWRRLLHDLRHQLVAAPFTTAAIGVALLDLVGRALGVPVTTLLGGRHRDVIEMHGSVGWDEDSAVMRANALPQAEQFTMIKLYAGRGEISEDLARLDAVREEIGDGHPFLLDINGLWTPLQTMQAAPRLARAGVVMVEQPVAPSDGRGMREVTRCLGEQYGIDVVVDEGVRRPSDVLTVTSERSARVVNVGLSRLGGIVAATDTATVAAAAGLGVMVGSVVELGVATAAGLHLAASLPALAYPSYLMGPLKYACQITHPPLVPVDGRLDVPTGPGLGIDVDVDAVEKLDLRRA